MQTTPAGQEVSNSMNSYSIYVPYQATRIVRGVVAENEEDAIDNVVDLEVETLCSTCSAHYDISADGDWENADAEEDHTRWAEVVEDIDREEV